MPLLAWKEIEATRIKLAPKPPEVYVERGHLPPKRGDQFKKPH